jgi:hypothetical protein
VSLPLRNREVLPPRSQQQQQQQRGETGQDAAGGHHSEVRGAERPGEGSRVEGGESGSRVGAASTARRPRSWPGRDKSG